MTLTIGTRGSALARAQAGDVLRWLEAAGHSARLSIIQTLGDQRQDRPFAQVGAPGIFVREIEAALQAGEIDLAVHSYKDLTSMGPEDLVVAAVPERLDPADHLLIRRGSYEPGRGLLAVGEGGVIGTASARRGALLRHHRPDLKTAMLRGNVPTRVQRLKDGEFDGILLAGAGLERLRRTEGAALFGEDIVAQRLDPTQFVPAPSQGALALQVRRGDAPTLKAVGAVKDPAITDLVACERALLTLVEGGCQLPFGAYCEAIPEGLRLTAFLEVGGVGRRVQLDGREPEPLAAAAWARLRTWEGERPWKAGAL